MIKVYPAESRYTANHGWLISNFSFSFAEYYDRNNVNFGPMRVLNDDIVHPRRGFGAHPHQEMEIVSIVLKGYLKHEDSTGHAATTTFGGVQRMSAGTGVIHSEVNPSETEEVNFLQMWFLPDTQGLPPSYEQTNFEINKMKNELLPVVAKNPSSKDVAHINQDLTIYLSELEEGKEIDFTQGEGRRIFLFVLEGELQVKGSGNGEAGEETTLVKRDSARITDTPAIHLSTTAGAQFMLIDLP